jgi:hypothetical protein
MCFAYQEQFFLRQAAVVRDRRVEGGQVGGQGDGDAGGPLVLNT